jgi:hypothetical protein
VTRALAIAVFGIASVALTDCKPKPIAEVKITQFRVNPDLIPRGISGKLCYGVENAVKLELTPAVEEILPANERCIDISPVKTTTYTLTAYGDDGKKVAKSLDVHVGNPAPRVSDLSATPTVVKRGSQVQVCFKVENARSVKVSRGKFDSKANCLTDKPQKTTTYKIVALGPDREEDTGTVTVKVH